MSRARPLESACHNAADMGEEAPPLPRWAVALLGMLGAAALYTLHRGARVTLEHFDGYSFLVTARRLAAGPDTVDLNFYRRRCWRSSMPTR